LDLRRLVQLQLELERLAELVVGLARQLWMLAWLVGKLELVLARIEIRLRRVLRRRCLSRLIVVHLLLAFLCYFSENQV
jgi:hypothetical protein